MAVIAGIDEAGYGPTLGPLVVGGTAFRVPDDLLGASLWDVLRDSCTVEVTRHGRRLPITDSKKLHRGRDGMTLLERTALVMLAAMGRRPATIRELVREMSPAAEEMFRTYAWYTFGDLSLPLSPTTGDLGTRATAVKRDCRRNGVEWLGAIAELLPEGHFNRLVNRTQNKAVVLMGLVLRVAERLRALAPHEPIRIVVDRLGGRQHYREALCTSWPTHEMRILEETDGRSAYRLDKQGSVWEVEFAVGGESRHLPVALASVFAKYLREACMHLFNAYWGQHADAPGPTAGYYTDAQRWLREAGPLLDRLGVDRRTLIRDR